MLINCKQEEKVAIMKHNINIFLLFNTIVTIYLDIIILFINHF